MTISQQELDGLHTGSAQGETSRYRLDLFVPRTSLTVRFRVFDDDPFVFSDPPGAQPAVIVAHALPWAEGTSIFGIETNSLVAAYSIDDAAYGTIHAATTDDVLDVIRFRTPDHQFADREAWSFMYSLEAIEGQPPGFLIDRDSFAAQPAPAGLRWSEFFTDTPESRTQQVVVQVTDSAQAALRFVPLVLTRPDGTIETALTETDGRAVLAPTGGTGARIDVSPNYGPPAGFTPTPGDALEVLRMAVALEPSFGAATPTAFIAADINRDGQVTADDALSILRLASGLDSDVRPQWVFVDAAADLGSTVTGRNAVNYATGAQLAEAQDSVMLKGILLGNFDTFT
ncbi:MAG: hypothetical protein JJU19_05570 [Pararhodobacter sp.]|nr:hypothetical protein [Pararhodobacter sp.]